MDLVSGAGQALAAILSVAWHAPLAILVFWVAYREAKR